MRVVSLAPHLTQIVMDLGLDDALVGVAEHDAVAPHGLPVVGNYVDINMEKLLSLRPTHVLTVASKDSPSMQIKHMATRGVFKLYAFTYPTTIGDIADTVYRQVGDQKGGVAAALDARVAGLQLRTDFLDAMASLRRKTAGLPRPRTLMVFGMSPLGASGPGTVNHAALACAGGVNALPVDSGTYTVLDREALLALNPEVVLLLRPGDPQLRAGDPRIRTLAGLPIEAVVSGRVSLLNDPCVLLPSTSLPRVATAMARALHPTAAIDPQPGEAHARSR